MRTVRRICATVLVVSGIAAAPITSTRAQAGPQTGMASLPDPAVLMQAIASQPFRYGGDVEGSLLGLPEIGARPVHLAIGLGTPSADGTVKGGVLLFDGGRHLLAEGQVDGVVRPATGLAPCTLRLHIDGVALPNGAPTATALPVGTVVLAGSCSASTLAGEIRANPPTPALLGRLIFWWGDRETDGRYWLNAASFDPPPATSASL